MKYLSVIFLSATRLLAVISLLLAWTAAAQANPVLSLKGSTLAVKQQDDSEIRLSVLGYDDADSTAAFASRYQEYAGNGNLGSFTDYIKSRETRGYIFTAEATGYTIKYAWQDPAAEGQRMVFVVTPGLQTLNPYLWHSANQDNSEFSVLELRFDGEEAILKTSLDADVVVSSDTLSLDKFDAAPVFARLQDNTPYYLKQGS